MTSLNKLRIPWLLHSRPHTLINCNNSFTSCSIFVSCFLRFYSRIARSWLHVHEKLEFRSRCFSLFYCYNLSAMVLQGYLVRCGRGSDAIAFVSGRAINYSATGNKSRRDGAKVKVNNSGNQVESAHKFVSEKLT